MPDTQPINIVYDNQCPICRNYVARLKATDDVDLRLIDARQPGAMMDEITVRGLDIDEGMVVKVGDKIYYGSDAIAEISKYTKDENFVGLVNRFVFRSPFLARIVYPLCKTARNILLKILGISKIDNLKKRN